MPYAMTHMIIANNISKLLNYDAKGLSQFFLGSIAPDAIIGDKRKSHLFVGSEEWGYMTNHNECADNAIAFLTNNRQSNSFDFISGYIVHILSDIYHHLTFTTPLRCKDADMHSKLYSQESIKVNIELAQTYDQKDKIFLYLRNSIAVDLPGIVCSIDIEKIKSKVLDDWYQDKTRQDLKSNKVITFENNMNYIGEATKYIISIIQKLDLFKNI